MPYTEEEYYYKADNLIRISCQVLQEIFRDRWNLLSGNEWTQESAQIFINGLGKEIYKSARKIQKSMLSQGILEEWDLSLLARILPSFNTHDSDKERGKQETLAIQNLSSVRNHLAHSGTKKLTSAQYNEDEHTVRQSLLTLGIAEAKISKLIARAGITSSVAALEQANKFRVQGDNAYSKGHYSQAIKFFDEALLVPSLLPINLGSFYEKRAACYLALGNDKKLSTLSSSQYYDQAMIDIEQALECNESSWKAHEIIAHIYRAKHDIKNVIAHLTKALAISPGQAAVKEQLQVCKLLANQMTREEHMDPRSAPVTLEEVAEHYSKRAGHHITPEMYLKLGKEMGKYLPGQDFVQAGHQYACGWSVQQNYQEAARLYAKAMNAGNAEGIYNLAILYANGRGVAQDICYAIELLTKAANMPEKIRMYGTLQPVMGVKEAQHSLGLKYHDGVGVPQNYEKAAYWYSRAADNGLGQAAHNLALLYHSGKGVKKDTKKAEMYWRRAVEKGDMNAAHSLCVYYQQEMEPELAKLMFETAVGLKHDRLLSIKNEIYEAIEKIAEIRAGLEERVLKFEEDRNLSTQGLTFRERMNRMMIGGIFDGKDETDDDKSAQRNTQDCEYGAATAEATSTLKSNLTKILDNNPFAFFRASRHAWTDDNTIGWAGMFRYCNFDQISQKAEEGSVTAHRILQAAGYNMFMIELWGNGPPFSETRASNLINFIYLRCAVEHHVCFVTSVEMMVGLLEFLKTMYESKCDQKGDLDRKTRLCYGFHVKDKGNDALLVEILKVGLQRYPNEVHYYHLLSSVYGFTEQNELGYQVANDGLAKFPDHVELLYCKAVHTRLTMQSLDCQHLVRKAYEKFLLVAPEDHRKVPEAYYCIGLNCLSGLVKNFDFKRPFSFKDNFVDCSKSKALAKEYYEKGFKAEKIQLACYLPYESTTKLQLQSFVGAIFSKHKYSESGPSTSATASKIDNSSSGEKMPPQVCNSSKLYLKDPKRIEVIKAHRERKHGMGHAENLNLHCIVNSTEPDLKHSLPKKMSNLQAITLQEMSPTVDKIYQNKMLNLTLIDDPIFTMPSVHLVAMDENRDVTRLFLYNFPQSKIAREQLEFGGRLSIINPYMRMCADGKNAIRVDQPKCIIYMDKVEKMCRYCGEANAAHNCSRCKRARYCGRECQLQDWKKLDHKLICRS